jgi:glycosyltransferase involved in cell wall biosynthesis
MTKRNVMIGTAIGGPGGVAAVLNIYLESGFFDRYQIVYIASHSTMGNIQKIMVMIKGFFQFFLMLAKNQVNLVHFQVSTGASFWRKAIFIVLAHCFRRPVIMHIHGGRFKDFFSAQPRVLKKVIQWVLNSSDVVIVLSPGWKTWFESISVNKSILAIYNAVHVKPKKERLFVFPINLLCLGRLGHNKGTYDLLAAMPKLLKKYPDLKLRLAGDGEIEQAREASQRLGIADAVEVLGLVGSERKNRLLEEATIYILPSYAEGLPMSVLEAMAAHLPIITTPVGGIPEAVTNGIEGFLISPGDIDAIYNRVDQLLSDKVLRNKMADSGYEKVKQHFSVEATLFELEKVYKRFGGDLC